MDILPPVAAHSYKQHNKQLAQHSMEMATSKMLAASAHFYRLHGAKSTDIIDIAVTCIGTWSKRGFTANMGWWQSLPGKPVKDFSLRSSPSAAQFVP